MFNTESDCVVHSGSSNSTATDEHKFRDLSRKPAAARNEADGRLAEAVKRVLCAATHPALRTIQIVSERGVVTLRGHVPSYHQKQLAQTMVQRVAGVRSIANGIEVVYCRQPGFRTGRPDSTTHHALGNGST